MNTDTPWVNTDSSTDTPWVDIDTPELLADRIVALYEERGTRRYSEAVNQVEHALQCGTLASAAGASDAVVLAAYLHDIGHLLLQADRRREENRARDLHHEHVGARFLSRWLGADVTEPIALHVPAKRYLCATEGDYFDGLSPASVHSLELQGGAFEPETAEAFIAQDHAAEAVDLRRWDDLAKVSGADTNDLDHLRSLITAQATIPG